MVAVAGIHATRERTHGVPCNGTDARVQALMPSPRRSIVIPSGSLQVAVAGGASGTPTGGYPQPARVNVHNGVASAVASHDRLIHLSGGSTTGMPMPTIARFVSAPAVQSSTPRAPVPEVLAVSSTHGVGTPRAAPCSTPRFSAVSPAIYVAGGSLQVGGPQEPAPPVVRRSVIIPRMSSAEARVSVIARDRTQHEPHSVLRAVQNLEDEQVIVKTVSEAQGSAKIDEVKTAKGPEFAEEAPSSRRAEEGISEAQLAWQETLEALGSVSRKELLELKAYKSPPIGVRSVLSAICVLRRVTPARVRDHTGKMADDYWPSAVAMLSEPDFLQALRTFDKRNVPQGILDKVATFTSREDCQAERLVLVSRAAWRLHMWVRAVEVYARAGKAVLAEQDTPPPHREIEAAALSEAVAGCSGMTAIPEPNVEEGLGDEPTVPAPPRLRSLKETSTLNSKQASPKSDARRSPRASPRSQPVVSSSSKPTLVDTAKPRPKPPALNKASPQAVKSERSPKASAQPPNSLSSPKGAGPRSPLAGRASKATKPVPAEAAAKTAKVPPQEVRRKSVERRRSSERAACVPPAEASQRKDVSSQKVVLSSKQAKVVSFDAEAHDENSLDACSNMSRSQTAKSEGTCSNMSRTQTGKSEVWEDDTVDERQMKIAAKLAKRLASANTKVVNSRRR